MDNSIKICFNTSIFIIVIIGICLIFGIVAGIMYKNNRLVSKNVELENNLIKDLNVEI